MAHEPRTHRRSPRTIVEAVAILKKRYQEQCERFPITRDIPEPLYVSRNLVDTIKGPWVEIDGA